MNQIKKLELKELKRIYKDHVREDFPRSERRPFSSMKKMTEEGKYACFGYYDGCRLLAYACYIISTGEKRISAWSEDDEQDGKQIHNQKQSLKYDLNCNRSINYSCNHVHNYNNRNHVHDHNCNYRYDFGSHGTLLKNESRQYALLDYFAVVPELRGQGIGGEFLRNLSSLKLAENGIFIEAESPDSAPSDKEANHRRRRIHFYLSNGAILTNTKCLLFGVDYNILYMGQRGMVPSTEQLHCAVENLYWEIYRPVYGRLCKPYLKG